jgi:TolB protein
MSKLRWSVRTGPFGEEAEAVESTKSVVVVAVLLVVGAAMTGCLDEGASDDESLPEAPTGSNTHPAWSPDGTRIAFISNTEGVRSGRPINFEVYLALPDGSDERRLTVNNEFESDLAWSPDGEKILFKSFRDGNDEVYVMDADGGNQKNLTNDPGSDGGGTWSPDGSTILFQSDRAADGTGTFFLMNADGSDVRAFPGDPGAGHSARWSPDGERIAFVSDRDGNGEIYVMDSDGSNLRRITDDPLENGYPRWSPDGSGIAYTIGSFDTDRWAIVASDADGGNPREVVGNADSGNVAWSPDGTRLIFGRYRRYGDSGGEESRLHIVDLETGEVTPIRDEQETD